MSPETAAQRARRERVEQARRDGDKYRTKGSSLTGQVPDTKRAATVTSTERKDHR